MTAVAGIRDEYAVVVTNSAPSDATGAVATDGYLYRDARAVGRAGALEQ